MPPNNDDALKKKLTRLDIRAKRLTLETALEALERIEDDLDTELVQLQQMCTHPETDSTPDDGAVTNWCEDCGLTWTSKR